MIGGMFLLAGTLHDQNVFYFFKSINAYQIVDAGMAIVLGTVLPKLQIVAGVCLIVGVFQRPACLVVVGMLTMFPCAGVHVLISGKEVSCGCFGAADIPIDVAHILLTIVLLAVLLVCYRSMVTTGIANGRH